MRFSLALILLYAVVQSLFVGMAVAIGSLLHWLVPGLNVGMGTLVGMLSTIASAYVFVQMMKFGQYLPLNAIVSEDDDDDDEDDDVVETRVTAKSPHTQRRRSQRNR